MFTLNTIANRMVLRYAEGAAFSFNKLTPTASDEGIHTLAGYIANLQDTEPRHIVKVETLELV